MKKIVIYLSVLILFINLPNVSYAAGVTQNAEISKIENDIYGFDYINDELTRRVERLEKTIYGKV